MGTISGILVFNRDHVRELRVQSGTMSRNLVIHTVEDQVRKFSVQSETMSRNSLFNQVPCHGIECSIRDHIRELSVQSETMSGSSLFNQVPCHWIQCSIRDHVRGCKHVRARAFRADSPPTRRAWPPHNHCCHVVANYGSNV